MDNVTDIKDAPKKKARQATLKGADRYHALMDSINDTTWNQLPAFSSRLHLIEPDIGTKFALKELADQVVIEVPDQHVIDLVMQYTQRELGRMESFRITVNQAQAAVAYWKSSTTAKDQPALVRWHDEVGLTYRRLPWVRELGETPTWDELVARMGEEGNAFVAWVGSLFCQESDRQQYLWLYGHGQNGKGAITRFLSKVLGRAFRSEQAPRPDDRFWTRNLMGARLVSFPDCNSVGFPASGLFKSMTGDDDVRMEIKNGAVFHAQLTCKFMFSSNDKPTLSSDVADMRRPIFISLAPIACAPSPTYEAQLWAEGGYFLSKCIEFYEAQYPAHGRILVSNEALAAHVATLEERFETILDASFQVLPEQPGRVLRDYEFSSGTELQEICRRYSLTEIDRRKFVRFLEVNHGIANLQVKLENGKKCWRYVRLKPIYNRL